MSNKPAFSATACTVLLFIVNTIFNTSMAQTVTITYPRDGERLGKLTSIEGLAYEKGGSPIDYVGISLAKAESDEEWSNVGAKHIYRWTLGPTGRWLGTFLGSPRSTHTSWSAPSGEYYLPSGKDLPNGRYIIYAYARNADGIRGEETRVTFTIER